MQRLRDGGNPHVDCHDLEGFHFNFEPWSEKQQPQDLHSAGISRGSTSVRVMSKANHQAHNVSLHIDKGI